MTYIIRSLLLVFVFILTGCNDKTQEVIEEKFPDGSPKTVKYYLENNGKKSLVKEIDYYANKHKRLEGEYKNDQRNGKWTYFYENGKIWSEGFFVDDINDGKRTTYFENGQIRYQGSYKMGDRIGKWQFYNENGDLVKEMDYGEGTSDINTVEDSVN
jgi:antitoxin component YwqK of YwqJK toxin-antitoxin module